YGESAERLVDESLRGAAFWARLADLGRAYTQTMNGAPVPVRTSHRACAMPHMRRFGKTQAVSRDGASPMRTCTAPANRRVPGPGLPALRTRGFGRATARRAASRSLRFFARFLK